MGAVFALIHGERRREVSTNTLALLLHPYSAILQVKLNTFVSELSVNFGR